MRTFRILLGLAFFLGICESIQGNDESVIESSAIVKEVNDEYNEQKISKTTRNHIQ